MASTERKFNEGQCADLRALISLLEAAALNAQNLLHVANRELLDDLERGLSVVAAADRFVSDVIVISERLRVATAEPTVQP